MDKLKLFLYDLFMPSVSWIVLYAIIRLYSSQDILSVRTQPKILNTTPQDHPVNTETSLQEQEISEESLQWEREIIGLAKSTNRPLA